MAIYHLRLKVLSRSLGRAARPGGATRRSAIAAAAYRSGEKIWDATQARWFEYDNAVVHQEILAPQGAPSWVFDRQALWNLVEHSEKRADAQLAREVEITLPRELSRDQQVELVRSFARNHFVRDGMVADIAIHEPMAVDGLRQPHAHIMLTMRRLDPASPTGFARTKERDWNERPEVAKALSQARMLFNETRLPEHKAALETIEAQRRVNVWRASWSRNANRALERAGSSSRIDHRTLAAQGITRPAQPYFGLARHIEHAYSYLKERLTQWVAVKKRASLYAEMEHYKRRDPAKLVDFVLRLNDMAEDFASQFRRHKPIPEVPLDR